MAYREPKTTKTYQISRHRVVVEISTDHPGKPLTHDSNRLMTSAFQLIPNGEQRRTHPFMVDLVKERRDNSIGIPDS